MMSKRWQNSLLWICSLLSAMTTGRTEEEFSLIGCCGVVLLADMVSKC